MSLGEFGSGHLDLHRINLSHASSDKKAEYFGKRAGCPIVPRLIEERGADVMAHRYAQVLAYYGWVVKEVKGVRPDIAKRIKGPLTRLPGEPLADFDPKWIPAENYTKIPGTETPSGYALPRLITYYIYDSKTFGSPADRMVRALDYFNETLRELRPHEKENTLLVQFAEKLVTKGKADPKAILKNTISAGKLMQDSFFTYFYQIGQEMKQSAPILWDIYSHMSPAEKTVLRIANVAR